MRERGRSSGCKEESRREVHTWSSASLHKNPSSSWMCSTLQVSESSAGMETFSMRSSRSFAF
ncbi:hypothetical protein NE237_011746 [Protea cynaroides]|uniref:Uncharacterized protein n=1 Tax=Protea cynaroides TaxID=273540 RepID=A0A9Q0JYM9_9MAGN|nr:hypothetical protein NE237_011746 [Protea cynaroides]